VSYLAISQWKAAALQPPSLKAICPWEGFTDAYRDLMRPGGIREGGFLRIWSRVLRRVRQRYRLVDEQRRRPLLDEWWRGLVPALEQITVPALICGSFSDNNLHSRGSFRGWEGVSSSDRFLYTHRGGKWTTSTPPRPAPRSSGSSTATCAAAIVPAPPPVRLEVRERRDLVAGVREEGRWPLDRTEWTPLYLTAAGLATAPPSADGQITFGMRSRGACWEWTLPADAELTGPMALKASLRALDEQRSRPFDPVPTFDHRQPLAPGEVVPVDIALGPSATRFRAGETLRLVVAGRWLWPRNPFTGQFPTAYQRGPNGACTLHWGRTARRACSSPSFPDRALTLLPFSSSPPVGGGPDQRPAGPLYTRWALGSGSGHPLPKASSSIGRVPVSKTGGWGFESLLACHSFRRLTGASA
jgi:uncharacterized protein